MQKLRVLFVSGCIEFIYLATVYNLDTFLVIIERFTSYEAPEYIDPDNWAFLFILITLFSMYLYIRLSCKYDFSPLFITFACSATFILVDSTTLIWGRDLIPIRFPIASLFPLIGCLAGYLYHQQKRTYMYVTLLLTALFLGLFHSVLLSKIYMNKMEVEVSIPNDITQQTFVAENGEDVILESLLKEKTLIDFYFAGCAPCIQKEAALKKIKEKTPDAQLIFICNGKLTSYEKNIKYVEQHRINGAIYLHDTYQVLKKYPQIMSYPHEIILKDKQIIKEFRGYFEPLEEYYLKERLSILQNE